MSLDSTIITQPAREGSPYHKAWMSLYVYKGVNLSLYMQDQDDEDALVYLTRESVAQLVEAMQKFLDTTPKWRVGDTINTIDELKSLPKWTVVADANGDAAVCLEEGGDWISLIAINNPSGGPISPGYVMSRWPGLRVIHLWRVGDND